MHSIWSVVLLVATVGVLAQDSDETGRPCGFKISPCRYDMTCEPNSDDCTNMNVCAGTCQWTNKYPACGSRGMARCNEATAECVNDPRSPSGCSMACDIPGICKPKSPPQCGGFMGLECPKGLFCYDRLDDGCDPEEGGADCMGICL